MKTETSDTPPDVPVSVFDSGLDRTMVMQRRGPGQRGQGRTHKGDRDSIMIRPRRTLGDLIREQADEAGMTITDFVATHMAEALGHPELAPQHAETQDQEVLPLATSA